MSSDRTSDGVEQSGSSSGSPPEGRTFRSCSAGIRRLVRAQVSSWVRIQPSPLLPRVQHRKNQPGAGLSRVRTCPPACHAGALTAELWLARWRTTLGSWGSWIRCSQPFCCIKPEPHQQHASCTPQRNRTAHQNGCDLVNVEVKTTSHQTQSHHFQSWPFPKPIPFGKLFGLHPGFSSNLTWCLQNRKHDRKLKQLSSQINLFRS